MLLSEEEYNLKCDDEDDETGKDGDDEMSNDDGNDTDGEYRMDEGGYNEY